MDILIEKQSPNKIVQLSSDRWFADFGKDAYGRLEYEIEADAPTQVEFVIGEVLFNENAIERNPGGFRCIKTHVEKLPAGTSHGFMSIPKHRSVYSYPSCQRSKVLTPEIAGGEIAPFRYAELHGNVKSVRFTRHALFSPFDDNAAQFECSDANLNKVWELCKYTMKATSAFGLYIDGERERQCFEGDAYINTLGAYCTGGGYDVARRTLDFLIQFYPIEIIEYRLLTTMLVRNYFLYSGDTDIYKYWKEELHKRLLPQFVSADGMIHFPKEIHNSDAALIKSLKLYYQYYDVFPDSVQILIDWPRDERDNYQFGEICFVPQAFLYAAYRTMDELEPNCGYDRMAASLLDTINAVFRRDNGLFVDNSQGNHTAIHTALWAIAFGIAQPKDYPALHALIKSRGMACSPYGAQFLLDALFMSGAEQTAIELMRSEEKRSWMNMIRRGSTISMEAWDNEFKPNQDWNHAWGAAPANIIPRRLAGIRPIANGFTRFVVDPKPADLKEFAITHPTPHGAISLEYADGKYSLTVPEGTEAVVAGKTLKAGKHDVTTASRRRRTAVPKAKSQIWNEGSKPITL